MTNLDRLEASLRAAAARGRERVAVPGFAAFVHVSPNPYLSVAVPDGPDPDDWGAALAGLAAALARRGRRARIEAFAEARPGLMAAADAAGWARSMTAPVMVLGAGARTAAPEPSGGTYRPLDPDDGARLEAALRGQHLAYGGTPGDPSELDWLPTLRDGLRGGWVRAGAVDVGGVPVAGATLQYGADAAELAGVWTHPDHRRRGHARVACHALLGAAFDDGLALAWLSAAEGALALYEGLGFVRVGTQVNLEAP